MYVIIRAEVSPHNRIAFSDWSVPDEVTRATREYPDTLDNASFGAVTPVKPKSLSPSDPASWGAKGKPRADGVKRIFTTRTGVHFSECAFRKRFAPPPPFSQTLINSGVLPIWKIAGPCSD